ncbi:MAG: hypothetical protein AB1427_13770 [Thermodesulfobacteriota bacterium]
MKLVFYADGNTEVGDRLLQKIQDQVSASVVQAYRSFDDFQQGLVGRGWKPNAAILLASNTTELKRIITLGKLLTDTRVLLVLPDRRKETVAAGHRLRPRYISYADDGFEDVVAVVKQILKRLPTHEA